jgi:hypothetical protein
MSAKDPTPSLTHHAMLVAWGLYAKQIGLIEALCFCQAKLPAEINEKGQHQEK